MVDCPFFSIKINKNLIYVLSYWLCEIVFRLLNYIKPFNIDFIFTDNTRNNEYLYILLLTFADLLACFQKIKKCKKSEEKIIENLIEEKENENLIEENVVNNNNDDYGSPINHGRKKKFLYLTLIIVVDLFARSFYFLYYIIFNKEGEEVSQKFMHDSIILIDILARYLFYKIFIKKCKIGSRKYCHSLFSIMALIILFSLLIFIDYMNLDSSGKYDFKECLIFSGFISFRSILFPFADTIIKKFMEQKYLLPFQYMRRRGIIEAILLSILTVILILTSNFNFSSDMFSLFNGGMALLFVLLCFIKSILLLKVIYEYSSQAVSFLIISEPLSESIYGMINNVNHEGTRFGYLTGEIIIIFLIAIITMIYEEIIIVKICGCDKNVKATIQERAIDDKNNSTFLDRSANDLSATVLSINMNEQ